MASVCLAGRCERATRRMISSFSQAGYLIRVPPHPLSHVFFEQPQLQHLFGDHFFESSGFTPQLCDFARVGLANNVPGQALLAGLHEVLGPLVIKTLGNAFTSTQLGHAVFAT